ncbi:hypothetical protein GCM10010341_30940 [Streptomyces noursei]|nr:hypothetical protein GCM10010341_30940 [Streptomyces noursei]
MPGAVVRHHIGLGDDFHRPHGHQGRVAGAEPDAEEATGGPLRGLGRLVRRAVAGLLLAHAYSSSLARALIAAAAMALPPRRPRTTM